jgi:hypothetical protein
MLEYFGGELLGNVVLFLFSNRRIIEQADAVSLMGRRIRITFTLIFVIDIVNSSNTTFSWPSLLGCRIAWARISVTAIGTTVPADLAVREKL